MGFIDILILIVCIAGLSYFVYKRIKYSNRDVYSHKLERYKELHKLICKINADNEKMESLILSANTDFDFNSALTDKLIEYRDNEEKLELYKQEYKEIELYLRKARPYFGNHEF